MEKIEKRQSRKVGVAGSFQNQLMGNNSTTPEVGKGATILMYSDRHPYEVISVSDDGNSCKIRELDFEFVGESYGDERYILSSNPEGNVSTLEWNEKKGKWGYAWREVQVIKALFKRLLDEYSYGWSKHLPNGVKYDDLVIGEYAGVNTRLKLVKGITKEYKRFSPVSIVFGSADKYRDPHF